jgi:hypothetical protein
MTMNKQAAHLKGIPLLAAWGASLAMSYGSLAALGWAIYAIAT